MQLSEKENGENTNSFYLCMETQVFCSFMTTKRLKKIERMTSISCFDTLKLQSLLLVQQQKLSYDDMTSSKHESEKKNVKKKGKERTEVTKVTLNYLRVKFTSN